uniref:integumentary mucin C.1-like n=1 Tax=Styela clava TaxID=7725 RepID=UPI00193A352E|nr:integumentary mucin C.1-like [Styela clava]
MDMKIAIVLAIWFLSIWNLGQTYNFPAFTGGNSGTPSSSTTIWTTTLATTTRTTTLATTTPTTTLATTTPTTTLATTTPTTTLATTTPTTTFATTTPTTTLATTTPTTTLATTTPTTTLATTTPTTTLATTTPTTTLATTTPTTTLATTTPASTTTTVPTSTLSSTTLGCPGGYEKNPNGTNPTCIDINECALRKQCFMTGQVCFNTLGSYTCICAEGLAQAVSNGESNGCFPVTSMTQRFEMPFTEQLGNTSSLDL